MTSRDDAKRATAASAGAGELTLRPMGSDPGDLRAFQATFARNSDRPRSLTSLRWQYVENCTGRLYVDVAVPEGPERLAAIYATLPGWFRVRGERRLAIQSLDTLTDADFRGRGLFVKLASRTFERAAGDGAAFVYGFPNGNSAHGFFQRLSWTRLDPVPFLIRPLRSRYFAERLPRLARRLATHVPDVRLVFGPEPGLRGASLLEELPTDGEVTALWESFASGVDVALERDGRFLRWRIEQKPDEDYVTLSLRRDGELRALCIFTTKAKHGGRIGYVMELMHRPDARRDAARLLAVAVRRMAAAGADAVLAWCFSHSRNFAAYVQNGFAPMPERLRPIELHFGARALDPSIAPVVGDRRSWYISYLDSDTV